MSAPVREVHFYGEHKTQSRRMGDPSGMRLFFDF